MTGGNYSSIQQLQWKTFDIPGPLLNPQDMKKHRSASKIKKKEISEGEITIRHESQSKGCGDISKQQRRTLDRKAGARGKGEVTLKETLKEISLA